MERCFLLSVLGKHTPNVFEGISGLKFPHRYTTNLKVVFLTNVIEGLIGSAPGLTLSPPTLLMTHHLAPSPQSNNRCLEYIVGSVSDDMLLNETDWMRLGLHVNLI